MVHNNLYLDMANWLAQRSLVRGDIYLRPWTAYGTPVHGTTVFVLINPATPIPVSFQPDEPVFCQLLMNGDELELLYHRVRVSQGKRRKSLTHRRILDLIDKVGRPVIWTNLFSYPTENARLLEEFLRGAPKVPFTEHLPALLKMVQPKQIWLFGDDAHRLAKVNMATHVVLLPHPADPDYWSNSRWDDAVKLACEK